LLLIAGGCAASLSCIYLRTHPPTTTITTIMESADTMDARPSSHPVAAAVCDGTPSSTSTGTDAATALEWPSLELLQPGNTGGSRVLWSKAVAPAVTVVGRLVEPYVDIMVTHISPNYPTIMMALKDLAGDGAVASFQAAWDELGKTENGRAVIAVCHVAAQDGALLGRLYMTRTAEEADLEHRLADYYKGKEYLPALLAALEYYRSQTAGIAAAASASASAPPADNIPSLALLKRGTQWLPSEVWRIAVAPAVVAAGRIIARFIPASAISMLGPNSDAVVMALQSLGLDEKIPEFLAEWEKLGSTRDGRAVITVCAAASREGVGLGEWRYLTTLAADACLDCDLEELYGGKECLPVMQAAVRYYRDHEPAAAGGVAGGAWMKAAGGAEVAFRGAAATCYAAAVADCAAAASAAEAGGM